MIFESAGDFFNSAAGEVLVEQTHGCDDDGFIHFERRVMRINGETYELTVEQCSHEERSSFQEEWRKNGVLHREGDLAAVTIVTSHAILEETHLDQSVQRFYSKGELQDEVDSTYEDITNAKPVPVRQYFGCDV